MSYAAARGGRDAIEAAERLLAHAPSTHTSAPLTEIQLVERLGAAVDKVIGEGGLWDPEYESRQVVGIA